MKPENLFHTGIVVDDLDATMDWFTKVADYRWTDVVEAEQIGQTPQGEVTIPMRISPHLRPTDWRARSSRTTPTVPGSFCRRIPRARLDRASNSSAGPGTVHRILVVDRAGTLTDQRVGSFRMCWAMMLRWISEVPPAMVPAKLPI